jgi:hypothetical protein
VKKKRMILGRREYFKGNRTKRKIKRRLREKERKIPPSSSSSFSPTFLHTLFSFFIIFCFFLFLEGREEERKVEGDDVSFPNAKTFAVKIPDPQKFFV